MIEYEFGMSHQDLRAVYGWLTTSYWSPGVTLSEVESAFSNSLLCIGAFDCGRQIAVGRVVSDGVRIGYIADVYVDESYRRKQIGRNMVRLLMSHPQVRHVKRWLLFTKDAHDVYRDLGFETLKDPETIMLCYDFSKALS